MGSFQDSKQFYYFLRIAFSLCVISILMTGCGESTRTTKNISENKSYTFWPQFPSEPRIQFLTSYRVSSDIEPKRSGLDELVFGRDARALPIGKPYGLEIHNGRIYICDIQNPGVVVLDLKKHETRIMGTSGLGGMAQPTDIAIAPDGMKYVTDVKRGLIFVFDATEHHVATLGHTNLKPVGIAVHNENLYICDFQTQSVLIMDRQSGEVSRTIGGPEGDSALFVRPLGIEVDNEGNIYVVDVISCRLQKFAPDGKRIWVTGQISDTAGTFTRPKHLEVDHDGIIYVVDAAFSNVQMFNNKNQVLMYFGSSGSHDGAMDLPAGISISSEDIDLFQEFIHPDFIAEKIIAVTNQFGRQKVSVYAMGKLREGVTARDIASSTAAVSSGITDEDNATLTDELINKEKEQEEPKSDQSDKTDSGGGSGDYK